MFNNALSFVDRSPARTPWTRRPSARAVYRSLMRERDGAPGSIDEMARHSSCIFLSDRLAQAARLPSDLPDDPSGLAVWINENHRAVALEYEQYLGARKAGAPRRYFADRSHALYFLRAVAPTKKVDGAWLYGLLPHWRDARFAGLIRIYLEELGNGVAAQNHMSLYGRLLREHDCDDWQGLDDAFFNQGAIQLSLAHNAAQFLPEIIGFNLGYEQLPLHLLVTAYELTELGIDPYYFTLHVTVDNASTGHARRAIEAVADLAPRIGGRDDFHRRVALGYRLNQLPLGTIEAIAGFDLERELLRMLEAKAMVGARMHSDYCRINGRTVNEWLSSAESVKGFLDALVARGWIRRGHPVQESRFWQLLQGEAAPMSGVFSAYEQQLLQDWISHDQGVGAGGEGIIPAAVHRFRAARDGASRSPAAPTVAVAGTTLDELIRACLPSSQHASLPLDPDLQMLKDRVRRADSRAEAIDMLIPLMSPAHHATPAGLAATRLFTGLLAAPA